MEYIHVANMELSVDNPLDAFLKGEEKWTKRSYG
jgi:hypothetical protein